jgi:hypothetical protein
MAIMYVVENKMKSLGDQHLDRRQYSVKYERASKIICIEIHRELNKF